MIGGRSDQRVLLPFASSGPGRLECAENKRQISHLRARAPPHELRTSGSSTSVRSDRDPDADTMLGQRLGTASDRRRGDRLGRHARVRLRDHRQAAGSVAGRGAAPAGRGSTRQDSGYAAAAGRDELGPGRQARPGIHDHDGAAAGSGAPPAH